MLDRTVFFSRDTAFKSPFGAVTLGQEVTFTLRPRTWQGFTRCCLRVYEEFGNVSKEIELPAAGVEGEAAGAEGLARPMATAPTIMTAVSSQATQVFCKNFIAFS